MTSFRELLAATRSQIREVDPATASDALAAGAVLLDVREPDEIAQGAVPGSAHIVRGNLEAQVESRLPDKSVPVVVMCAGGTRSAFAARTLQDLGYVDVVSMEGGFNRWKNEDRS
ncbi:MAG: rhodanese-like domain-containing protein, partial [Acidimicrobiia bacterium]|nr:rhodanese-like domain-containing protein [Acidimicrobiia bacterium]